MTADDFSIVTSPAVVDRRYSKSLRVPRIICFRSQPNFRERGGNMAELTNIDAIQKDRDALRGEIRKALMTVNQNARRYRRMNTTLLIVGLLFGLLATGLAADASRGGKVLAANIA